MPSHAKKYMASIQRFLVKEEQKTYVFNLASLLKLLVLCAVPKLLSEYTLHFLGYHTPLQNCKCALFLGLMNSATKVLWVLGVTTLMPNKTQAQTVREMICGGNRDFVYGSHPTIGPIFVADTTQYNLKNAENMLPNIANLVEDVVFNYDPADVKDYMWRTTLSGGAVAVKHLPTVTDPGVAVKG